jgi:2-polyprenyl-3-methyl-5-hydroxy-6-metoxy-1,4-benzoquinol methylase
VERRIYYDHEPAYRDLAARGGHGWDDFFTDDPPDDSYAALGQFLDSSACPRPLPASVLDLGCGGGQAAILLAQRGFRVVGVDYSETAIALARRNALRAGVQSTFHVGDCTALSFFETEAFDLVIDNHVSHCLIEPEHRQHFFLHARRLLQPAGVFFSETMVACEHFDPLVMNVPAGQNHNVRKTRIWVARGQFTAELESVGFRILSQDERPQDPVAAGCLLVTVASPSG